MSVMPDAALAPLLKRLSHRDEKIRDEAKREALDLPPEQLLQLARMEAARYHRRKRFGYVAAAVTLALILGLILWLHSFNYGMFQLFRLVLPAFLLFVPRRGRRSVAELLAESTDIRLLGPALEIATRTTHDRQVRRMALDTVKSLLPGVRADHASLLSVDQRAMLALLLEDPLEDHELTLRILNALKQVGGAEAITAVESLAGLKGKRVHLQMEVSDLFRRGMGDNSREIRETAAECLPYLRANAERYEQQQTLLRASSATSITTPDVLLRPAYPVESTTPAEELLRASAPDADARSENTHQSPKTRESTAPQNENVLILTQEADS